MKKVYSFQFFSVATNSGCYRTTRHLYKINFQSSTKVASLHNDLISTSTPHYIPLSMKFAPEFDIDYLIGKLNNYALSSI